MSTEKRMDKIKINSVIRVALEEMRDKCKSKMETIATQGGKGHFAYVCQQVGQEQAENVLALLDSGKIRIEIVEQ